MELFLQLHGGSAATARKRPPPPPPPPPRPPPAQPTAFNPTAFNPTAFNPPVLLLASMRFLQRGALVHALETAWSVYLLDRERLTVAAACDVDLVLDERTCVVVLTLADVAAAPLLAFLLTTVARAYTSCWLLLDASDDDARGTGSATLGHLAACFPGLRRAVDLDVRAVVARSTDELAAWVRVAVQGALEAAVARGTWTQAQWLQRDWLEPLESRVRT